MKESSCDGPHIQTPFCLSVRSGGRVRLPAGGGAAGEVSHAQLGAGALRHLRPAGARLHLHRVRCADQTLDGQGKQGRVGGDKRKVNQQ